jgi:hypothetical protein
MFNQDEYLIENADHRRALTVGRPAAARDGGDIQRGVMVTAL